MRIKEYPEADYVSVELEKDEKLPEIAARYIRVSVPADSLRVTEFSDSGFIWTDRNIGVKVPLKSSTDFKRRCRMPAELSDDHREEIRKIAQESFREDSRFAVTPSEERERLAEKMIDLWLKEQKEAFVCRYGETAAGFAEVRCTERHCGMPFIHLAAVGEAYRAAGAAMSLYAAIFDHYKEEGAKAVYGRISSKNMAVMNLYSSFGAQFLEPCDIYIKK